MGNSPNIFVSFIKHTDKGSIKLDKVAWVPADNMYAKVVLTSLYRYYTYTHTSPFHRCYYGYTNLGNKNVYVIKAQMFIEGTVEMQACLKPKRITKKAKKDLKHCLLFFLLFLTL